jgi:hypothetical protein
MKGTSKIVLRALLDEAETVFINCGYTLDWFVGADSDATVCVVTVDEETGDQHQMLVRKGRLSDITVQEG